MHSLWRSRIQSGISPAPALTNNLEALNQEYYNGTLQTHIENIELLLEEGLELPSGFCVEFDLDGLLRMDTATLTSTLTESVKAGIRSPNEAREDLGLGPVQGGESPLAQQQMWTLEALANRPAAPASPAPPQPQQGQPPQPANQNQQAAALAALRKELAHAHG